MRKLILVFMIICSWHPLSSCEEVPEIDLFNDVVNVFYRKGGYCVYELSTDSYECLRALSNALQYMSDNLYEKALRQYKCAMYFYIENRLKDPYLYSCIKLGYEVCVQECEEQEESLFLK